LRIGELVPRHRLERSAALNALAIGGFIKDVIGVFASTVSGSAVPGISGPKMAQILKTYSGS
jgi:hypothetical protein